MNYKRLYENIIDNRKENPYDGYTENHHIVPKSLGGSDDSDNLIALSAREHFICHYLLAKMYEKDTNEWYRMNLAFMMMKCESVEQHRYFNSRLYDALKTNHSNLMSVVQTGKGNSQYGTMWISNVELKQNKKIGKDEPIPDGWVKGRNVWNKKRSREEYLQDRIDSGRKKAYELWGKFIDGDYNSMKEFADIECDFTFQSLSRLWLTYVPEYKEHSTQGKKFKK